MLKGCTPWPAEFARSYRDAGYWKGLSLWGMLERAIDRWPDKIALVRIGVIPVSALAAHRRVEIDHFVEHSGAVAYLVADRMRDFDYRPMAAEIAAGRRALRHVLVLGEAGPGQTSLSALMRIAAPRDAASLLAPHAPGPDEVAVMLLSGGTTGLSKLIPRTHDDYVYNARPSCGAASKSASSASTRRATAPGRGCCA